MEAAREVYCLFDGRTGTVTDRPLPGLGPTPQQFGTTSYIEMGTSSRSICDSESIPYPYGLVSMPLKNSNFAGIDGY